MYKRNRNKYWYRRCGMGRIQPAFTGNECINSSERLQTKYMIRCDLLCERDKEIKLFNGNLYLVH